VTLRFLEETAIPALDEAMRARVLLVIDEIGKMESLSDPFRDFVERAFRSGSPILATIRARGLRLAEDLRSRAGVETWEVTRGNRDTPATGRGGGGRPRWPALHSPSWSGSRRTRRGAPRDSPPDRRPSSGGDECYMIPAARGFAKTDRRESGSAPRPAWTDISSTSKLIICSAGIHQSAFFTWRVRSSFPTPSSYQPATMLKCTAGTNRQPRS